MADIQDTGFRLVLRLDVFSPTSVQEVRAYLQDWFATADIEIGTFDLLRLEPESSMKQGVSGAPDKIKTKKRRAKKDGKSVQDET